MKLIAKVTLVTPEGDIPPGDEIEVKDAREAAGLVERGFAEASARKSGKQSGADLDHPADAPAGQ